MSEVEFKLVQVRLPVHERLIRKKSDWETARERTVTLNEIIREGLDALDRQEAGAA